MSRFAGLKFASVVLLTLFLALPLAWGAPQQEVRGTVKDRSGAVVARAQVLLRADGQEFSRVTQPDGTFVFTGVSAASGSMIVSAPGFATSTTAVAGGPERPVHHAHSGDGAAKPRRDLDAHLDPADRR